MEFPLRLNILTMLNFEKINVFIISKIEISGELSIEFLILKLSLATWVITSTITVSEWPPECLSVLDSVW